MSSNPSAAAAADSQSHFDKATIDTVNRLLAQTGERERLKEMLRVKLIECGWSDRVHSECINEIKTHGIDKVNPQDLLGTILPKAKSIIPDAVKKELLQEISRFLEANMP